MAKQFAIDIVREASDRFGLEWDSDSMLQAVCNFIDDQNLNDDFRAYVGEMAEDEKDLEEASSHGVDMDDDIVVEDGHARLSSEE